MTILGIDPGKTGGCALISWKNGDRYIEVFSFKDKTEFEIAEYFRKLNMKIHCAYLEKVHSAPGQGVKSMFTFGQVYGFIRGILTSYAIPFEEVMPQVWQRALRIPPRNGKTYAEHKKFLRQVAQQRFPNIKTNAETADALLIAQYGVLASNSSSKMDI